MKTFLMIHNINVVKSRSRLKLFSSRIKHCPYMSTAFFQVRSTVSLFMTYFRAHSKNITYIWVQKKYAANGNVVRMSFTISTECTLILMFGDFECEWNISDYVSLKLFFLSHKTKQISFNFYIISIKVYFANQEVMFMFKYCRYCVAVMDVGIVKSVMR